MTLHERCLAFNAAYAKWPASHLSLVSESRQPVIYGRWLGGADYRNKTRYLERVMALFPDVPRKHVLHVFSGSLPAGEYLRCDSHQPSELQCNVYDLPRVRFGGASKLPQPRLILADPPYSPEDAKKYGTAGVDRCRATAALAEIVNPGAFLVWLDTCWPMHNKRQWRTVGRIALTRSTNHRLRDVTIFERQAA